MKHITKCISCEEKINEDSDYYNYTDEGDIICEDCYDSDLENPVTIIDNKGDKYYKGEYVFMDKYGDNYSIPDVLKDYADLVDYKRTDGWRGYYEGKPPIGYKCIENRWFSGFDGHNMNDLMFRFHQIIENCSDILEGFDYFYAILPTSNVFSQNFELYIKENQKEEFLNTINEEF